MYIFTYKVYLLWVAKKAQTSVCVAHFYCISLLTVVLQLAFWYFPRFPALFLGISYSKRVSRQEPRWAPFIYLIGHPSGAGSVLSIVTAPAPGRDLT